jgi:hypothetical protein
LLTVPRGMVQIQICTIDPAAPETGLERSMFPTPTHAPPNIE